MGGISHNAALTTRGWPALSGADVDIGVRKSVSRLEALVDATA